MQQSPIPFIDIRDRSPLAVLEAHPDRCRELIEASKGAFGLLSRIIAGVALPLGDRITRRWLEKTDNPYREEIFAYAEKTGIPGLLALNLCYEWGCTSGVYRNGQAMLLSRILDWPFPALGKTMVVAHQRGIAGDFYNVTWPGMCGIYNAMAPGRFAAAINQAPMRRYRLDIMTDWIRNRIRTYRHHTLPPAHLLRKVFETAGSYEEAKRMLAQEPIALPVIFILSGTHPGEGCVIERLENQAAIRELDAEGRVCAANHFETHLNGIGAGWLPRAIDSNKRAAAGCRITTELLDDNFRWFTPPLANPLSRLALVADAGNGKLQVMGTEGAEPVTQVFSL